MRTVFYAFAIAMAAAFSLSGCVLVVPFVEEDHSASDRQLPAAPVVAAASFTAAPRREPGALLKSSRLAKKPLIPHWVRTSRKPSVRELLAQLEHHDAAVRTNAATDLGLIGASAAKALPSLIHAVRFDESKWVRRAAVKALVKISSSDPSVIEALRHALRDRNEWVAHSAAGALRKVQAQAASGPAKGANDPA